MRPTPAKMEPGSCDEPDPLARALKGRCPHCGSPGLFSGLVELGRSCHSCGLNFEKFNVGDGPAAFLIFIVGALVTGGAIWLELAASPPWWAHLVWLPIAGSLTILGLRLGKAALLAQEYKHRANKGRTGQ